MLYGRFLACTITRGHVFVRSRARPGLETCSYCYHCRPVREMAADTMTAAVPPASRGDLDGAAET
jgi:hypothetical protein